MRHPKWRVWSLEEKVRAAVEAARAEGAPEASATKRR